MPVTGDSSTRSGCRTGILLLLLTTLALSLFLPKAAGSFAPAKRAGDVELQSCPDGTSFDLLTIKCWKCPSGFSKRFYLTWNDDDACEYTKPPEDQAAIKTKERGCQSGEIFDLANVHPKDGSGPECWTCPRGYSRSIFHINSDKACAKSTGFLRWDYKRANYEHKAWCQGDDFDGLNGNCYRCNSGFSRVLLTRTCRKTFKTEVKPAILAASPLCEDKNAFFDVFLGKCYKCPSTHPIRTLIVGPEGPKACTNSFWEITGLDTCRIAISSVRDTIDAFQDLEDKVDEALGPVKDLIDLIADGVSGAAELALKPVTDAMQPLVNKGANFVKSALTSVGKCGDFDAASELLRISTTLERHATKLRQLLLNPDVVCTGKFDTILDYIGKIDLMPSATKPCFSAADSSFHLAMGLQVRLSSPSILGGRLGIAINVDFTPSFDLKDGALQLSFDIFSQLEGCKKTLCYEVSLSAGPTCTSFEDLGDPDTLVNGDLNSVTLIYPKSPSAWYKLITNQPAPPPSPPKPGEDTQSGGVSVDFATNWDNVIKLIDGKPINSPVVEFSVSKTLASSDGKGALTKKDDDDSPIQDFGFEVKFVSIPIMSWTPSGSCSTKWRPGSWGSCSALTCAAQGQRTRSVDCVRNSDNKPFADKYCTGTKPASSESCSRQCSYAWTVGPYGLCDAECDAQGTRSRSVQCFGSDGLQAADSKCGTKPASQEACTGACGFSYQWQVSPWETCPGELCGVSVDQTRNVVCIRNDNQQVDDALCPAAERPDDVQPCTNPCSGAWFLDWAALTPCSSNNCTEPGVQTCSVYCHDANGVSIDVKNCAGEPPVCSTECTIPCAPEDETLAPLFEWTVTPADECLATGCDGAGSQPVNVNCKPVGSTDDDTVDDSNCDQSTKPANVQACITTDTCNYDWAVGPFGECSGITCGASGNATRDVSCVRQETNETVDSTKCPAATRPSSVQDCIETSSAACTYEWSVTQWTDCNGTSCGDKGFETRGYQCVRSDNAIVEDSFCTEVEPSEQVRECVVDDENSCPYVWAGSVYGECLGEICDSNGVATRSVACVDSASYLNGTTVVVEEDKCALLPKPPTTTECYNPCCDDLTELITADGEVNLKVSSSSRKKCACVSFV